VIVVGADVSFRHAAAVALGDDGPIYREIVGVPARRRGEDWGAYIRRGFDTHDEAIRRLIASHGEAMLAVEMFPELIPNNQHQAPAVAAGAWWAGAWPSPVRYVEIMDWRRAVYGRSLIASRRTAAQRKQLAIDVVTARWGPGIFEGLTTKDLRGDVAEATLIALYQREWIGGR